ncbi:CHAD domain-containing protein [Sphingobacteriales bacterium UPWRP_1]|nr:hypothetical protein BVG80_14905 [Sphingobacteriales bacterium TSM_CSM]PSJ73005.1 CHAD domain-containing protein [Sphingobacteriales bacterium UPWRP_1]
MKNLNTLKTRCLKKEGKKMFVRLNRALKKAAQTCSEPDIHQMRVAVKKWRALLALTAFAGHGAKQKKFAKPYRKLFSVSGNIRDAQVHALFLQDHHLTAKLQPYLQNLKQEEENSKQMLKAKYRLFKEKTPVGKRIKQLNFLLSKITPAEVAAYTARCIAKAKKRIAGSYTNEEELHQLRKLLKQWQYNAALLQSCGFQQSGGQQLIDFLIPFNELLGKWQDSTVAIDYLNELQNGEQQATISPKTFSKLYAEIAKVKATQQQSIMAALPNLNALFAKMEQQHE